jgi:hypothetical protein
VRITKTTEVPCPPWCQRLSADAATPTAPQWQLFVVAVVARLNAARMTVGKAPLGFLNPFLYQLRGEGFTDITTVSTTAAPLN